MNKILFVCTGNTCRSPMCAALFNALYSESLGITAFSRGLAADSSPITPNAAAALESVGIVSSPHNSYKDHISKTVCSDDIESCDAVYCVTERHSAVLKSAFPECSAKIRTLPVTIADPYGMDLEVYKRCLEDISKALQILFVHDSAESSPAFVYKAGMDQLDNVLRIENESFSCPWSEKSFIQAFNSERISVFAVNDTDGSPAGFTCLLIIGNEAEILNIAVSPAYRRCGYADLLMKHILEVCEEASVEFIYLEVRSSNIPAQTLYQKYGFEKIGIRKKYYTDPVEDAVLMKKLIERS